MIFLPERGIFFEINTKMKSRREKNQILCVKIWRRTIGRRIKFQPGIYSPWNINYFCFWMFLSKNHGFGHKGWLRTVRYFLTSVFIGSLPSLGELKGPLVYLVECRWNFIYWIQCKFMVPLTTYKKNIFQNRSFDRVFLGSKIWPFWVKKFFFSKCFLYYFNLVNVKIGPRKALNSVIITSSVNNR